MLRDAGQPLAIAAALTMIRFSQVSWQYDHSLWLHPAPDVLVLADRQDQFQCTYEEVWRASCLSTPAPGHHFPIQARML